MSFFSVFECLKAQKHIKDTSRRGELLFAPNKNYLLPTLIELVSDELLNKSSIDFDKSTVKLSMIDIDQP